MISEDEHRMHVEVKGALHEIRDLIEMVRVRVDSFDKRDTFIPECIKTRLDALTLIVESELANYLLLDMKHGRWK